MQVHYTGRHVSISDEDKAKAQRRFEKIHRILSQSDLEAHVVFSKQRNTCEAEVTLRALRHTLVVTGHNAQAVRALGEALNKLEKQAVKSKHKLVDTRRPMRKRGEPAASVAELTPEPNEPSSAASPGPQIFEAGGPEGKPMTVEGARLALEDGDLDQVTFRELETDAVCVLVRRRDGNLELVRV